MLRCALAFAVFGLLPLVSQGDDVSPSPDKTFTPLTAPKPLVPLDEIDGPLPLDFVVAKLDGESITLLELGSSVSSDAAMQKVQESFESYRLRQIQEDLIETHLGHFLKNRLFVRHCKRELSEDQSARLELWLSFGWESRRQQLLRDYDAKSIEELETSLLQRDLKSLSELRQDYENRGIIDRYWHGLGRQATEERIEQMFQDANCRSVMELPRVIRILGL